MTVAFPQEREPPSDLSGLPRKHHDPPVSLQAFHPENCLNGTTSPARAVITSTALRKLDSLSSPPKLPCVAHGHRVVFVCSNLRLTVGEDLLPLSAQKSPNLFGTFYNGLPRSIGTFCHCSQRIAPFYPETLTTTTDWTTDLLLQSDRLVFGMH